MEWASEQKSLQDKLSQCRTKLTDKEAKVWFTVNTFALQSMPIHQFHLQGGWGGEELHIIVGVQEAIIIITSPVAIYFSVVIR